MSRKEIDARSRARRRGEDVPKMQPGPKPGYKQTSEHIAKRLMWGEAHPRWRGDAVNDKTSRQRAQRRFGTTGRCEVCRAAYALIRHHRDHNPLNNDPSNIAILCHYCHMVEHTRLRHSRGFAERPHQWEGEKMVVAKRIGESDARRRIREAVELFGYRLVSLEWEPVGRGAEMEGPSGGWLGYIERPDGQHLDASDIMGYSADGVLDWIDNFVRPVEACDCPKADPVARLRAQLQNHQPKCRYFLKYRLSWFWNR